MNSCRQLFRSARASSGVSLRAGPRETMATAPTVTTALIAATARNVACHHELSPTSVPRGAPSTATEEKPRNTAPRALPRRSGGAKRATNPEAVAVKMAAAAAEMSREVISVA